MAANHNSNISNHENINNTNNANNNQEENSDVIKMEETPTSGASELEEIMDYCQEWFDDMCFFNGYDSYTPTWDKDDFFQDVMTKVIKDIHKYDPSRAGLQVWYELIGRTVYFKHFNKVKSRPIVESLEIKNEEGKESNKQDKCEKAQSAEEVYMKKVACDFLRSEVAKLQDNYRKVIELTYFGELNASEVAKRLGCSENDVYRWRARGLKKLKEALEEANFKSSMFSGLAS